MKKLIYIILAVLLAGIVVKATTHNTATDDFEKAWMRIDSLENQGLYRSALVMAEKVYQQSRMQADQENEIRALIYRLKYTQELEEDGQEKAIALLKREAPDDRLVPAALKSSLLAELYQRYFSANRWKIFQRSDEDIEVKRLGDLETKRPRDLEIGKWGPQDFYRNILECYRKSLSKPEKLSQIRTSTLKGIWTGSLADTVNSPTLYDVLIRRALNFIQSAGEYPVMALRPAVMCSEELFLDSDRYLKAIPEQELNSSDPWYQALRWFGDWLEISGKSLRADLERLQYLHNESCHHGRDSLYLNALERIAAGYSGKPQAADIYERLAEYHLEMAGRYGINDSDTAKYKGERRKAKDCLEKGGIWEETRAGKNCSNMLSSLMAPELSAQTEAVQVPGNWFPVSIEYRNLGQVYFRIYRIGALNYYSEWQEMEADVRLNRLAALKPLRSGKLAIEDDGDLNPHRTNLLMQPLSPGFYLITFSSGPIWLEGKVTAVVTPVAVSRIALISRQKEAGSRDFYFRDRYTGAALVGLEVVPYYSLYDPGQRKSILEKGKKFRSAEEGILSVPDGAPERDSHSPKAYRLLLISLKDTLMTPDSFYPGYFGRTGAVRTGASFYTDRGLYKPGDRVWFRGVLIDYHSDSIAIHHQDSIVLTLQDSRYQVIKKITIPVDRYGVFTGSLELPLKGLTGNYILQSPYGSVSVSMEQYQRPSFTLAIHGGSTAYQNGDSIRVTGRVTALSGEPVTDAEVLVEADLAPQYQLRRRMPDHGRKTRVYTGKTRTDSTGNFTWTWASIQDANNPYGRGNALNYEITFRVTDLSGETHEEKTKVSCGKGSAYLESGLPDRLMIGDQQKTWIRATGQDGRFLDVPVRFRLSRLADPGKFFIDPMLPEPDRFVVSQKEWKRRVPMLPYRNEHNPSSRKVVVLVFESELQTDSASTVDWTASSAWKEGWYRVEISSDHPAIAGTLVRNVYLENPVTKEVPGDQELYGSVSNSKVRTGDILKLKTGSIQKGFILSELQLASGLLMNRWSESGKDISETIWTVGSDWQGGAFINVLMFRWNRVYQKKFAIDVPRNLTRLSITGLEKIGIVKPGDSLRLRLTVTDENGFPAQASMGITVYDASLDKIRPHSWPELSWPYFSGKPGFDPLHTGISASWAMINTDVEMVEVPYTEPLAINWWGFGYYGINRMEAPMMMKAAARAGAETQIVETHDDASLQDSGATPVETHNDASLQAPGNIPVQIRTDFRETALFNGRLISDSLGTAGVVLKVPEVFTQWKILVAGHTTDLATGNAEGLFQSARELMLKPNFPVFMRKGDTLDLVARLGWYGDQAISTVTDFSLEDLQGRKIVGWDPLTSLLPPGSTTRLSWKLAVDSDKKIKYILKSTDGREMDGLSDTIDVYPDAVELWRSQPFYLNKPGTRTIKIVGEVRNAVMEITTSPAWQVLLSFPVVSIRERDCSEYWFSRFYLAGMTGFIGDRLPAMRDFFTQHSNEEILDSLSHPLFRNSDIKNRSWSETPWSRTAENETNRVIQIRKWIDKNQRTEEVIYLLEKMAALQNPDGTWPWFRGMGSDWFVTQQIIAGFGELKSWQVFDIAGTQRGQNMIAKAIEAMDGWMSRQYRDQLRVDSTGRQKVQLNPLLIHYLYARSFYSGWTIAPKDEIAWLNYLDRIPQEWIHHEPGLQALLAIAAYQSGRAAVAVPIYRSLRERMLQSDEMGAYWPRKGYASSWFQWDIWMQSKMIELFAAMEEGRADLDKLRLYLIQQKRGRDWGNGMVAAWAAKSLLFYGTDWLSAPAAVGFRWGPEIFSPIRVNAGSRTPTGYYRYSWHTPAIIPKAKTLEVTHSGGGPAWGTLFTLENQKLDLLSATEGPLKLIRDITVRNSKGQWAPLSADRPIQPGELLRIRIRIQSDRDLSYIEVKDFLGTGFVPVQILSGYQYKAGLSWYQAREPESVLFYMPVLPKGEHTLEYTAIAEQAGNYFGGYSAIQSLYAPEFRAWSNSARIKAQR